MKTECTALIQAKEDHMAESVYKVIELVRHGEPPRPLLKKKRVQEPSNRPLHL